MRDPSSFNEWRAAIVGDPSSLNEWILDHGGGVFSLLTSQLVDSGLSPSPVRPTRLSFNLGLVP